MVDATIPTDHNTLPRQGIAAGQPFTIQITPTDPNTGTTYGPPTKPIKIICHTGGLIFIRPGNTCTIDDTQADMLAPGQYINTTPNNNLITIISDTDSIVSFIRKP